MVEKMKVDQIIKNAKIFTSDENNLHATALAVKDGKFVYVGDDEGLNDFEGEVRDLGGKFIMPCIIDSHVHVPLSVVYDYMPIDSIIECTNKKECTDFIAEVIKNNPGKKRYMIMLEIEKLNGEIITKEDLDSVCPDAELVILEKEGHSIWVNSKVLDLHGITDDTPDIVPELSFYVRDDDGHVTGNMYEGAEMAIILEHGMELSDKQIESSLQRWIDFSIDYGVSAVFEAGTPKADDFHKRCYKYLYEMDKQGRLPIYIDGSFAIMDPRDLQTAIEYVKLFKKEYGSEHMNTHTLKIFMDGTLAIHTAAMVTPYADTNTMGSTLLNKEQIADILIQLNEEGLDLHLHTVSENASRVLLDGVELARDKLGDDFNVKVTCAHLEIQDDADLERFEKLGVIANYTPWWHSGTAGGSSLNSVISLLGEERGRKMYRCKTLWDSGALVSWSSDNIVFDDFESWNPYLGMEVGMTRWINEKTKSDSENWSEDDFPPASEKMGIEEMILGYTVNGAKQLGIESAKGSIEVDKDADYLVFENNLLIAEPQGFSFNKPEEVYFSGKKMK